MTDRLKAVVLVVISQEVGTECVLVGRGSAIVLVTRHERPQVARFL